MAIENGKYQINRLLLNRIKRLYGFIQITIIRSELVERVPQMVGSTNYLSL